MTVEQIDSSQIHLWLAFLNESGSPHLLDEYSSVLSGAELRQQRRFHFARDRHRYLVTRAMVRTVLSKYADVAPRDWTFVVNPYGRPSIAAEHAAARGIEFNLSHTEGLAVMAIAGGRALGVDVENVSARRAALEVADRFFAPEEVAELFALPAEEQSRRFFEYWTLKESYIKARGLGLSIPLHSFAFQLKDSARIRLSIDSTLGDRPERWMFWQLRLAQQHLAAVCAEQFDAAPLELRPIRCFPVGGRHFEDI